MHLVTVGVADKVFDLLLVVAVRRAFSRSVYEHDILIFVVPQSLAHLLRGIYNGEGYLKNLGICLELFHGGYAVGICGDNAHFGVVIDGIDSGQLGQCGSFAHAGRPYKQHYGALEPFELDRLRLPDILAKQLLHHLSGRSLLLFHDIAYFPRQLMRKFLMRLILQQGKQESLHIGAVGAGVMGMAYRPRQGA
jgi:hypothetical protein